MIRTNISSFTHYGYSATLSVERYDELERVRIEA